MPNVENEAYLLIGEQLKLDVAGLLRMAGVVKARLGGGLLLKLNKAFVGTSERYFKYIYYIFISFYKTILIAYHYQ